MSWLRRWLHLRDYRRLKRNQRDPNRPQVRRPLIAIGSQNQKLMLALLRRNLSEYRMDSKHTIIKHVRTINNMIHTVINNHYIMDYYYKIVALENTLPDSFLSSFQTFKARIFEIESWGKNRNKRDFLKGKSRSYETLVYIFLEDYISKNLNKSSILSVSPNLRTSKCFNSSYP